MPFLTPLEVRKVGAARWMLTAALRYEAAPGRIVEVPAGFTTDFASIPRVFFLTTPPVGLYDPAATLHDYLYAVQATTRQEADDLFLLAMKDCGVGAYTRRKMYLAVRWFGGRYWDAHTQRRESAA